MRPRSRRRCCSSSWSGQRLPDEQAEDLLADEGLIFLRAPLAQRAPLPQAPAVRTGGEDPRREVANRRSRLDAPVRGADLRDRGARCRATSSTAHRPRPSQSSRERRARRRRIGPTTGETVAARRRAQPACAARPRAAPQHRRGRHRGARARACARGRSCSTRCSPTRPPTTACAATPAGSRRATSQTRPATSLSRRCRGRSRALRARRGAGTG